MDNQIDLLKDEYIEGVNNMELAENIASQFRGYGSQNLLNLEQQSFQSLSQENSPEIDDNKLSPYTDKRRSNAINSSFQKLQNMSSSWRSPTSSISNNLLNESQQMDSSPSKNIPNTVEFYHAYLAQLGENGASEPQAEPEVPEEDPPETNPVRESLGYSVPRSSIPQEIVEPEEIGFDSETFEQATMKAMKSISLKLETSSNASGSRNSLASEKKDVNNDENKRISTLPDERESVKEYNILINGQIRNKGSNSARQLRNTSEVFLNISTLAAINDRKYLLRKSLQLKSVKLDSKPEIEELQLNNDPEDEAQQIQKEEGSDLISEEKNTDKNQVDQKVDPVNTRMLENNKEFVQKYHLQNHYKNKASYQRSQDSFSLEQGDLLKESEEKALKLAFPSMKSLTRDMSCQFQSTNNFSFSIDDGPALDRSELIKEMAKKHQFLDRIQAESSPIPTVANQNNWDCSILEDQPTLEESQAQLVASVKKLNARTFSVSILG